MKRILLVLSIIITVISASGKDQLRYPEPITEPDVEGNKISISEKKVGYYNLDENGNFILRIDYIFKDGRQFSSITDMAIAQSLDGKWGLIGVDGAPQTEFIYEAIDGPNEKGYYIVKSGGKFGIIDYACFTWVPCKYDSMSDLFNGWYEVSEGDKWGYVHHSGAYASSYSEYEKKKVNLKE